MKDTNDLAVAQFKEEGAFLFRAGQAAETLKRRLAISHPDRLTFMLARDELSQLSLQFSRLVAIATEYHLGHTDS